MLKIRITVVCYNFFKRARSDSEALRCRTKRTSSTRNNILLEIKFRTYNRGTRTLARLHHYWSGFRARKNASEVYEPRGGIFA